MTDQETEPRTDHDSPWKEALDTYFREFTQLLFPEIHAAVDWSRGYETMDKELQKVTADAQSGRRHADKLMKVYTRDGTETWVLIHIEVQGKPEDEFAERMYTYQYRLWDRYKLEVVSLAVLADLSPDFRPTNYHYARWGCELSFTFPMTKLIDWEPRWAELANSPNVCALVVMAQIKAKRLKEGEERKRAKLVLIRLLFNRGYDRQQIQRLFHIIDWMIQLPKALEPEFAQAVFDIEEEQRMPYINTIERLGIEKGRFQGVQGTLRKQITIKYGELPKWADERLASASDAQLDVWVEEILSADSLETLLNKG